MSEPVPQTSGVMLIYEKDPSRLPHLIRSAEQDSQYRGHTFEGVSDREKALRRVEDPDVTLVSWLGMRKPKAEALKLLSAVDEVASQR